MPNTYDIIVAGHLCLDLMPGIGNVAPEALMRGGRLIESERLGVSTGGAVSNTGLALHRLGVPTGLMSTVGDDLLGQMITGFIKNFGADPSLISTRAGESSSYSVVLAPKAQDRSFLHYPGTNATFGAEQIDYEVVGNAKMFHLGYPPIMPRLIANDGEELAAIFREVKSRGVTTSMDMVVPDPNGPSGRANWKAILAATLPHVDIFIPSIDEARFMLRSSAPLRALAGELLAMGVKIAGFKLGEQGFYVRNAHYEYYHPAYEVTVAGTTGAGDSAYAGFLAALVRGLPLHACVQIACAVGACNVEQVDSTSGVRPWDEVFSRIESGWPTRSERPKDFQGGVVNERRFPKHWQDSAPRPSAEP